mmetsp:Transcript_5114/g.12066  ORF Transcript_5114/g.12066 Transcript_5114/m.12066 type:complete len:101 (-) Transcript_5114:82-384(-)
MIRVLPPFAAASLQHECLRIGGGKEEKHTSWALDLATDSAQRLITKAKRKVPRIFPRSECFTSAGQSLLPLGDVASKSATEAETWWMELTEASSAICCKS